MAMNSDLNPSRRSFVKGAAALGTLAPLSALLAACNSGTPAEDEPAGSAPATTTDTPAEPATSSTVLVAYYSAQGHTEAVAQTAADELGADIFEVTPAEPYSDENLNYNDESSRVVQEYEDESLRDTELTQATPDNWDSYSTVLVGYPIWWGIAAWPINNFISGNSWEGKTVIPFCTSLSSGIGQSGELLAELAGTGDWQEGQRFSSDASEDEVRAWASSLA